ncbi:hypothetical protein KW548_17685 [Vibrio neptunius]|uniref:hypothetical protein n=1 Tax=Vibrio neptunius TaxID=170651 RepID=UPI001C5CB985|nr:hypothetical protein [Vibrio neptunius]QXX08943.1 hypothetical protein KW548_17685 [Vibrio neptunius]
MYKFNFEIHPATELEPTASLFYLSISLINHTMGEDINLAKLVLEKIDQLDWFAENEAAIRNDKWPDICNDAYSVAMGINQFYDRVDPDSCSDEIEKMYKYRASHALRFAFRGQDLPDIVIAANSSGHEVSCAEDASTYKYDVDINSLFDEVDNGKKKLERLI